MQPPHLSQTRPQAPFALANKLGFVLWLLEFPALSVLPFLRFGIGYRLLAPARFIGMLLLASFGPDLVGRVANSIVRSIPFIGSSMPRIWIPLSPDLCLFALAMLALALVHRRVALWALRRNRGRHTSQPGTSIFAFLPLRRDLVRRFVDSSVCFAIGCYFYTHNSVVFGTWLMIAGWALYLFEQRYYDWLFGSHLDRFDAMKLGELQAELRLTGSIAAPAPSLALVPATPPKPIVRGLRARAYLAALRAFLWAWRKVVSVRNALSLPPFDLDTWEGRVAAEAEMELELLLTNPPTPAQQGSNAAFLKYLQNRQPRPQSAQPPSAHLT